MARPLELLNIWSGARARNPCQRSGEGFNQAAAEHVPEDCSSGRTCGGSGVYFGQKRIVPVATLYLHIAVP